MSAPRKIWANVIVESNGVGLCGEWNHADCGHLADEVYHHDDVVRERDAHIAALQAITERTVAMIARGRTLDSQAERVAREGGSGTPILWAAEAYDAMLDDLDRDARAALAKIAQEG